MGLFKRRAPDPETHVDEVAELKAHIAAMAQRLDRADADKAELGGHIQRLSSRLDAVPEQAPAPPPAGEVLSQAELDMLRARLQRLSDRVEEQSIINDRVESLSARIDVVSNTPPPPPTPSAADPAELIELRERLDAVTHQVAVLDDIAHQPSPPALDPVELFEIRQRLDAVTDQLATIGTDDVASPSVDPAQLADVERRLATLDEQLAALTAAPPSTPVPPPPPPPELAIDAAAVLARLDSLDSRLDALDGRITAISTELANQINELAGDVEQRGTAATSDDVVEEIRDAQARLANEQARYQIAFRQELAALAEQLKRA